MLAVALKFHQSLFSLDNRQKTRLFRTTVRSAVGAAIAGIALLLIGTVLVCLQEVVQFINWYSVSVVYFSIFRLFLMIYFIWGQVRVLKIFEMNASIFKGQDKSKQLKTIRFMAFRLLMTGIFTFFSLVCFCYAASPALYIGHGYFSLNVGFILTGFSVLLELVAVKSDDVHGFVDRMIDKLARTFALMKESSEDALLLADFDNNKESVISSPSRKATAAQRESK
eukprot:TRINITY_DN6428_c0_g1_i1.p1 TRINITY_DN6428_c0_g1~~TRINITY_DN6428_c0_g1_i1.p1  ORF type:complete len:225 (+),score=40.20 TRINITY_DN6428_c0_g1_i1:149-823(+)